MGTKEGGKGVVEKSEQDRGLPGMFDDPGHHFGRDLGRGNDQIALVLALSIVYDHDTFPIVNALERLLDRV
jgi:hypothetical protein